jgi:hypothetical protein
MVAKSLYLLGSNPAVIEGLHYDALPLQNLHTEFVSSYGRSLRVINIYEERRTRFFTFGFLRWD